MQARRYMIKMIKLLSILVVLLESSAGDDILIIYNKKNSEQKFRGKRLWKLRNRCKI